MRRPFDWEAAGARLGSELDDHHAIVVLGDDPVATAEVALGIGRAQSGRRRVAVCDLLGEAPPIQALVTGEDLHGIVDSFTYGVSLNRIAHQAPGTPGMFIMPTGTEPVDAEEIFPNTRWKRLASGFREMGALLILAARADAPSIEALVAQADGAVLVGETVPTLLPVASVISAIRQPTPVAPMTDVPVDFTAIEPQAPGSGRVAQFLKGGIAVLVISAIGIWFAIRPFDTSSQRPTQPPGPRPVDAVLPVSGTNASAGVAGATAGDSIGEIPVVANPADSVRASAWAVELLATNTAAGAAAKVRQEGDDLPAGTYAADIVDGAEWFKVMAGAYPSRALADSLLQLLRREGELDERSGSVVR
nr:SPOR domain-containing protein [Gemmatimonadaceae bacterium]